MTFEHSTANDTPERGSSRQGFLVNLQVEPGSSAARQMTAGSGRRLLRFLDECDPLGRFSRILLASETWGSPEYSLTWKHSVTKCGCSVFRLVPSVPRKGVSDTGLFVTWVSSTATDERRGSAKPRPQDTGVPLNQMLAALWPTPKRPQGGACRSEKNLAHLHRTDDVVPASGETAFGCLARTEKFVERLTTLSAWLMGYTKAYLRHWATASSRKSRRKSSTQ